MNASTNLPALTPANRSLPVADAIQDAIASLRRSGGQIPILRFFQANAAK